MDYLNVQTPLEVPKTKIRGNIRIKEVQSIQNRPKL